ncbi:MAG: hypothetical protein HY583_02905, partial [Candidatus Omnitrophica bacterium]|nr:hypothetical protein [Candidatus Omnitrophota bacterium]
MKNQNFRKLPSLVLILYFFSFPFKLLFSAPPDPSKEPQVNYLFRDTFYASPSLKLKYDVYEANGFLLIRESKRGSNTEFSVVTGFSDPVLEARILKNIRTIEAASAFLEKNTRKIFFERIPIKELPLIGKDGKPWPRFWVGQRAFSSLEGAKAKIIEAKSAIETQGGDFNRSLELITEFFPEEPAPTPQAVHANYLSEEELALKILDWLDVGEKDYGVLSLVPGHVIGVAPGEPILWQSFGETSFRWTNLDRAGFNDQVGYVTNRLVFKGLRFIGEPTIDPYVEVTVPLESQGAAHTKRLELIGGLEYRPFARVDYLYNFNIDGLYALRFARNFRFYVQYMERKNITDEITGSPDTDLRAGVDIFYEWGVDLDLPWAVHPRPEKVSEWIREYVWGEYFGNYHWRDTNFSSVDGYHAWIYNSSLVLGVKWPSIPLPRNPINDQLLLMPYLRLEHVTTPRRSEL